MPGSSRKSQCLSWTYSQASRHISYTAKKRARFDPLGEALRMGLACFRAAFSAFAVMLLSAVTVIGCGSKESTETPAVQVCVPSTVYSCVRGSCNGHQSCLQDGTAFTRCVCDDSEPKAGGGSDFAADAAALDAEIPKDAASDARAADAQPPATREFCDNGKDDDADGDVDCADADCRAMACVAEAPKGWHGPIALRLDAADSSCGGPFAQKVFEAGAQPDTSAAACSTCTCTGSDTSCAAFVDFGTGNMAECAGTTCTTSLNQSCAEIMPPCLAGLSTAYLQTKLPTAAGACTASEQKSTTPAATWKTKALACAPDSTQRGGCKSGQVCLPESPGAEFEANYCVWQDGAIDCPSSFAEKHTYYQELNDTRSCTACACSGPNCSYKWQVFNSSDTSCSAPLLELTSANQCVQVNPAADKLRVGASISGDGKCTASGGVSQGSVTAAKPVTVCCMR
jgi:hypothetical protein